MLMSLNNLAYIIIGATLAVISVLILVFVLCFEKRAFGDTVADEAEEKLNDRPCDATDLKSKYTHPVEVSHSFITK